MSLYNTLYFNLIVLISNFGVYEYEFLFNYSHAQWPVLRIERKIIFVNLFYLLVFIVPIRVQIYLVCVLNFASWSTLSCLLYLFYLYWLSMRFKFIHNALPQTMSFEVHGQWGLKCLFCKNCKTRKGKCILHIFCHSNCVEILLLMS